MAIIPAEEKVFMVSNSTNTTYSGSAALKAMQQWYTMQDVIDTVGGGGTPTLQEVTDAGYVTSNSILIIDEEEGPEQTYLTPTLITVNDQPNGSGVTLTFDGTITLLNNGRRSTLDNSNTTEDGVNLTYPDKPAGIYTIATETYKVFTALLTQSGGDNQAGINWDDPNPILTIGVTYTIQDNGGGLDMINVGAPNNNINTSFVATGTTPNSWGEGVVIYNTGAPVATILENTLGFNPYFTFAADGIYYSNNPEWFEIKASEAPVQVFINCGSDPGEYIYSAKANFTYEEGVLIITSFSGGALANDVLSDSDNFLKTSIEIRVYN